MRRFVAILYCLFASFGLLHSQEAHLLINSGIDDVKIKENIENNASAFLQKIVSSTGNTIVLDGVDISSSALDNISVLWSMTPFRCTDQVIVEPLISAYDGTYQIRNIPIELNLPEGSDADSYQEAVIDFDASGKIIGFKFGLSNNQYRDIMKSGHAVEDLRQRHIILDYVEQFRTAYCRKDIHFLEEVFSNDALIITGKVVRRKSDDMHIVPIEEIQYKSYNKPQYIKRLRENVFPNAKYIQVDFSDVRIAKHPTKQNYYGVRVRQKYDSGYYSDEGYLFMLWDFRDESHPQIHVRTWQPYWMDDEKTRTIPEDKIIDVNSFSGL